MSETLAEISPPAHVAQPEFDFAIDFIDDLSLLLSYISCHQKLSEQLNSYNDALVCCNELTEIILGATSYSLSNFM